MATPLRLSVTDDAETLHPKINGRNNLQIWRRILFATAILWEDFNLYVTFSYRPIAGAILPRPGAYDDVHRDIQPVFG